MTDYKCSFAVTLIKEDFACEKAQMVTRRTGPDVACTSEAASDRCKELFATFKVVGLAAFDAEDDLLKTPHSVFAKIQFGGLLGLALDVANTQDIERIENIYQLIRHAQQHYKSLDNIPHQQYVSSMMKYKIKRRRKLN